MSAYQSGTDLHSYPDNIKPRLTDSLILFNDGLLPKTENRPAKIKI